MEPENTPLKADYLMVPWTATNVAWAVLLFVVGSILILLIYQLAMKIFEVDPGMDDQLIILGLALGSMMLIVSWAMGPGLHSIPFSSLGTKLPWPEKPSHLMLPIMVAAASLLFTAVYTTIVSLLGLEILEPPDLPLGDFVASGPALVLSFFVVVLWGPFAEEALFRGFIFPGLSNNLGVFRAAMATSLLFAITHQQIGVIIPIFVIGLLLTWLYYETGSIWSSFVAHGLQNAAALSVHAWA